MPLSAEQRGFLAYVFETLSKEALRQVLGDAETEGLRLCVKRARPIHCFCAKAASMAATTSGASGTVLGSNRLRIFPSRPIRNLPKFHLMSPGNGESLPARAT